MTAYGRANATKTESLEVRQEVMGCIYDVQEESNPAFSILLVANTRTRDPIPFYLIYFSCNKTGDE